jgi:hypothetical protein
MITNAQKSIEIPPTRMTTRMRLHSTVFFLLGALWGSEQIYKETYQRNNGHPGHFR